MDRFNWQTRSWRSQFGLAWTIAGLTGLAWLFFVAMGVVPWIGSLFSLVVLVPMVLLGVYRSLNEVIVGGFVSSVTTLVLFGLPTAVIFALGVWLPAALMAQMMRTQASLETTIVLPSIGPLAAGLFGLILQRLTNGAVSLDSLRQSLRLQFDDVLSVYRSLGMTDQELKAMSSHIDQAVTVLLTFAPSILLCGVVSVVLINYGVVRRLLTWKLAGGAEPPVQLPACHRWQLHDAWIWAFIGLLVLLIIRPIPYRVVWMNLFVILAFAYLLQGVAVVSAWTTAHRIPRWMRYGATVIVIIQPLLLALVAFLGVADIWIDSRKLRSVASDA